MPKKNSSAPSVIAERMHKPGWKDPKLLMGLLLIVISLVAVVGVINATNKTQTYYVANRDISVGDSVEPSDLKVVEVRLGEADGLYLAASEELNQSIHAKQHIQKGELISANALQEPDEQGRCQVAIVLDSTVASSFSAGDYADIWVSHQEENGTSYSAPIQVIQAAEISQINTEDSMIGSTGKTAVQILVTDTALAEVLDAINNESKINLVPTSFGQK
ncbi:flagella basal body P-ring formation protein FlgA [uncultured Rothia sp.]|uniref:flagella basal body P-ring formation protein FlgA n=1 Tax=uncultured Rothia sp. TaxID=316088 RepID=UPI003217D2AA